MCQPGTTCLSKRFGMQAENQLYSFRYEGTDEPTLLLFGAALRRRIGADLRFHFCARCNPYSRGNCA